MTIQSQWHALWNPPVDGPKATMYIRLMTGSVFLWEGILKFVYANQGVGRFTKLGFPLPGPTAHVVAWVEIIGGLLVATFATLFFVPVMYSLLRRKTIKHEEEPLLQENAKEAVHA